jgi:molecular chaperone GrpE
MDAEKNNTNQPDNMDEMEKEIENPTEEIKDMSDLETDTSAQEISFEEIEEPELTEELEKSRKETEEWKDKYLRISAEFDNYRRRTLKEKMDLTKMAGQDVLVRILPVIDDFDRALNSMNQTQDCIAIKEGIELIYFKFQEFLKQQGIHEIDALHQEFDTDKHEALTKIPAEKKKYKGKVVDVVAKGYMLHDKVIRFAKVVVGE